MSFRAAQLRLEDSQRAADGMTAHIQGSARFGKANQGHQNVVQTERQQQTFAGTEDHRSEVAGAVNHVTEGINSHGKDRPDEGDNQTNQPEHHGGDNRYKTRAAEEG